MTSLLTRSGGLRPRGPPFAFTRGAPRSPLRSGGRARGAPGRHAARSSGLGLHRLANDLLEHPALPPAERPGLDDGDRVARLGLVLLVVHHECRRAPLGLAVQAVAYLPFDG